MRDLSEFLLARIAEDGASTFELIPYACEPGCCAPAGWVGHRCLICGTEEFGGTVQAITEIACEHDEKIHRRSRVLAECDARRRIVRDHAYLQHGCPVDDGEMAGVSWREPCDTLRAFAVVHADHPDYRDEWRP